MARSLIRNDDICEDHDMLFCEGRAHDLIVTLSMLIIFMAPFQGCHDQKLKFLPELDTACTDLIFLFVGDRAHVSDHLDDALELQLGDQVWIRLEHDVYRDFIEYLLLVGCICTICDIKKLKFVRPLQIVVDCILTIS